MIHKINALKHENIRLQAIVLQNTNDIEALGKKLSQTDQVISELLNILNGGNHDPRPAAASYRGLESWLVQQ